VRHEDEYNVVIWKKGWSIDDTYRAVTLPHGRGKTLADALDEALKDRM